MEQVRTKRPSALKRAVAAAEKKLNGLTGNRSSPKALGFANRSLTGAQPERKIAASIEEIQTEWALEASLVKREGRVALESPNWLDSRLPNNLRQAAQGSSSPSSSKLVTGTPVQHQQPWDTTGVPFDASPYSGDIAPSGATDGHIVVGVPVAHPSSSSTSEVPKESSCQPELQALEAREAHARQQIAELNLRQRTARSQEDDILQELQAKQHVASFLQEQLNESKRELKRANSRIQELHLRLNNSLQAIEAAVCPSNDLKATSPFGHGGENSLSGALRETSNLKAKLVDRLVDLPLAGVTDVTDTVQGHQTDHPLFISEFAVARPSKMVDVTQEGPRCSSLIDHEFKIDEPAVRSHHVVEDVPDWHGEFKTLDIQDHHQEVRCDVDLGESMQKASCSNVFEVEKAKDITVVDLDRLPTPATNRPSKEISRPVCESVCADATVAPRGESTGEAVLGCTLDCTHQEKPKQAGYLVFLHIYDVGGVGTVQLVNDLFRPVGTGAFHAGVEVFGLEWSYGWAERGKSGVYRCEPRLNRAHSYREPIAMGITTLSAEDVQQLVVKLGQEWSGDEYDLLSQNCCHFSDALCRGLGLGPIPTWVLNLAGAGAALSNGVDLAVSRAHAAAGAAAVTAGEIDDRLKISGTVEAFSTREISVDEEYLGARAMDWWSRAVEQVGQVGALVEKAIDHAQQPIETPQLDRLRIDSNWSESSGIMNAVSHFLGAPDGGVPVADISESIGGMKRFDGDNNTGIDDVAVAQVRVGSSVGTGHPTAMPLAALPAPRAPPPLMCAADEGVPSPPCSPPHVADERRSMPTR